MATLIFATVLLPTLFGSFSSGCVTVMTSIEKTAPANFSLKLSAGRFTNPGLKPLAYPKTHGGTPLAGASNITCGERRAALPACTRGLAAA
jgi:hypothetical protein